MAFFPTKRGVAGYSVKGESPQSHRPEEDKNDDANRNNALLKRPLLLKYIYKKDDQRSSTNRREKIVYDRNFLMKLRGYPNSNIEPLNLPDYIKDNSRSHSKYTQLTQGVLVDLLFQSQIRHELLHPMEGSQQGEPTNAAENLYGRVREVLEEPTPQKVHQLANEVKNLNIHSQEQLQGVVDLVFEKAIDEPKFMSTCALMCKEFAGIQVTCTGEEDDVVDFRSLIVRRCVMKFEDAVDETERAILERDIGASENSRASDFWEELTESQRRFRTQSFANIRFMGELFKQGMFTNFIMHKCIQHLLKQIDDESLECLCMLLIIIEKDLESKGQCLNEYFKQMLDIVNRKAPIKVSSRVRFKLQHVIQMRSHRLILSIDDCNPKTLDKTKKKLETQRPHTRLNITPMIVLKEEDPIRDRKRLCDHGSLKKCAQSPLVEGQERSYFVKTPELDNKSLPTDDLQFRKQNGSQELRTVSADTPKTETPNKFSGLKNTLGERAELGLTVTGSFNGSLAHRTAIILQEYLSDTKDPSISNVARKVSETFDDTTIVNFVREVLTAVVRNSVLARKRVGLLMTHLLSKNILPLPLYLTGLGQVLDSAKDLERYISDIWVHLAELILYPLAEGVHPFSELKTTMASLKNKGLAGKLMVDLTIMLVQEKTPKWIKDKWDQSGLQWRDFWPDSESTDFVEEFESDFLRIVSRSASSSTLGNQLSMEDIQGQLIRLMSFEQENSLINITNWISVHVGERIIESEFVKVLMTAILGASIELYNQRWQFRVDKFRNLKALIPRYIDVSINLVELQFLISIQEYEDQLEHPQNLHLQIIEKQTIESIVSFDVFDSLKNNNDLRPLNRRSIAILALKSYFTSLKDKSD